MIYTKACSDLLATYVKTYMLPVIEYASSVWSPHYAADIRKVERVQRKFTKRLLGCSKLSYADRLARLKLESLEVRRLRHDLILTYKILFGLTDMNQSDFFTFADITNSTRGHAYKLLPSHCRVDVRKCFFAKRALKPWNSLPAELHHFNSLSVLSNFIFNVDLSKFVAC